MIGTIDCVYETPCGWCTKWDKKCDAQIGSQKYEPVECAHEWEQTNLGGGEAHDGHIRTYTVYKCKLCGARKEVDD